MVVTKLILRGIYGNLTVFNLCSMSPIQKHHLGQETIHQMLLNEIILNSKTRTYPENQR